MSNRYQDVFLAFSSVQKLQFQQTAPPPTRHAPHELSGQLSLPVVHSAGRAVGATKKGFASCAGDKK